MDKITNIRIAGLGGMGVLKASLILSELLFEEGFDVKKAEVHGMSQRGGSISSDVRFGKKVVSPMIGEKKIDFLLSLEPEWSDEHKVSLAPDGVVISPANFDVSKLKSMKAVNVAALGVLSKYLDIPESRWLDVLGKFFQQKLHEANEEAFKLGRNSQ
jgi:pyruvate/ketoisovalerate oxidoreductase